MGCCGPAKSLVCRLRKKIITRPQFLLSKRPTNLDNRPIMDCCPIYMCEGILIEILSRLPLKSLVRFVAVCRLWKSIITSPQFRLVRPTKVLVHIDPKCYSFVEDDRENRLMFETDFPFKFYSGDCWEVVGSDNGLLCIGIRSRGVIIWNPFIRKHVVIPYKPNFIYHFASGFGGTISGNDYKYVRVVRLFVDGEAGSLKKAVEIYSLKAGMWRRKYLDWGITEGMRGRFFSCALLRGRLHWICDQGIFSFELEDEVFMDNIMLPESIQPPRKNLNVTVIRESLAVITTDETGPHSSTVCVWVMEEYGDVNSWIKKWNIDMGELCWVERNMVHLLKDDELLLVLRGSEDRSKLKLVTYNSKTKKTRSIGGKLVISSYGVRGFTNYYKESLVLLGDHRAVITAVQNQPTRWGL